jgi:hypothetical protein
LMIHLAKGLNSSCFRGGMEEDLFQAPWVWVQEIRGRTTIVLCGFDSCRTSGF